MLGSEVEILLVEDSDEDAELTARALRKRNLANKLHRVEDGAEALDFIYARGVYANRASADSPKMILLDLKLPKVGGLDVIRDVRGHNPSKAIPIVVFTSSKEDQDLQTAYDLGANSYIVKPVDFDQFSETMASLGMYWLLMNQAAD